MRHAHEAEFTFVVLREGFVVHPGIKWAIAGFHAKKAEQSNLNRVLFDEFENELARSATIADDAGQSLVPIIGVRSFFAF